jgi:flagellar basal-body rod protein FlgB
MSITDLPLFAMLKHRMYWHEERQRVLAENVANADSAGFRGRDLKQLDFHAALAAGARGSDPVRVAATAPGHIQGTGGNLRPAFQLKPHGLPVILEEEMMKVAQNQMDHQAATALYARGLGLIKTALGRK